MRRSLFVVLLIAAIIAFAGIPLQAAGPIPQQTSEFYVADRAGILSPETEAEIIRINKALHAQTKAQVVVATEPSLNGYTIEKYAEQIFQKWQIGDREQDNGVLLLIVKDDRKFRIEVGYGLEGRIPDSKAASILNGMTTLFRSNKFDQGTLQAFNQIVSLVAEEYQLDASNLGVPQAKPISQAEKDAVLIALILMGLGFLIVLALMAFTIFKITGEGSDETWSGGSSSSSSSRSSSSSSWSSDSSNSSTTGGGGSSGGGGASGGW